MILRTSRDLQSIGDGTPVVIIDGHKMRIWEAKNNYNGIMVRCFYEIRRGIYVETTYIFTSTGHDLTASLEPAKDIQRFIQDKRQQGELI